MTETKTSTKAKAPAKAEASKRELWFSRTAAEHQVVVAVDGEATVVQFADFCLGLDLSNDKDVQISQALKESGRWGRDIYIVGDAIDKGDAENLEELMNVVTHLTVRQLRALCGIESLADHNIINPRESSQARLLAAVIASRSLIFG